ncbi:Pyridine nucleotide-disulfide oxidoreductase domain-containing protein 2, partial [Orchesella cincta]
VGCSTSGRSKKCFYSTTVKDISDLKPAYDVVIVGAGGHNGLISAAYLQKAGYSVCVLEQRNVIGGAAITEEIVPGFKFSRASYVLSLLRPYIINDLKLKEHGLKFYMREPYCSYTPIKEKLWSDFPAKSLFLSNNPTLNTAEISKFSKKDAHAYEKYEEKMSKFVKAVVYLLDNRPPNLSNAPGDGSIMKKLKSLIPLWKAAKEIRGDIPEFHEMMTASASKILNRWFKSEPLKATLATDALIGTMSGPHTLGTGYVLLHHIMGGIDGKPGAWAYAEGGMGAVSSAIGSSAAQLGASIFTGQEIQEIVYSSEQGGKSRATGVVTKNGKEVRANLAVFSNATPEVTFRKLTNVQHAPTIFWRGVYEIVAVSRLPNFAADPNPTPIVFTIHTNEPMFAFFSLIHTLFTVQRILGGSNFKEKIYSTAQCPSTSYWLRPMFTKSMLVPTNSSARFVSMWK